MSTIRLIIEKVTSVLETEEVGADEVHCGCVPDFVNVDSIWETEGLGR